MVVAARLLAYGLFLLSGGTALIYQVAWLRELSLIFGASFYATSIVLASFMSGLALGGFVAGRLSERLARPLTVYGGLEVGIALFALALPGLLAGVDDIYVDAARQAGGVTPFLNVARVVLAFGVLVLPTFFMGATLPVLIRFTVHAYGELGTRLALLYGINTLGAASGALLAGFVLLPQLGTSATQQVAVGANLIIGALAIATDLLFVRRAPASMETGGAGAPVGVPSPDLSPDLGVLPLRLAFFGTAIAGMSALALEVMWTRAISLIIGSTTYSFTVMLAAFLIGIWLGSWLHALLPLQRINESVQFGTVLALVGVTSFLSSQLIPYVPYFVLWLNDFLYQDQQQLRFGTSLLGAFAVMLVPCVLLGIAFPVASQARARLMQRFGESVGDTLGLNTFGAILGSLGAGFLLIPTLGLQGGMTLASSLSIGYGLVVLAAAVGSRAAGRIGALALPATAVLAILLVTTAPFLAPRWDVGRLATFKHDRIRSYYEPPPGRRVPPPPTLNVLYYEEGRTSTVAVVDSEQGRDSRRYIAVNGKVVASDGTGDMDVELILGHVPVLLHPDPKSALVIGFGAGVTLGAVAAHRDIEELTLVEIAPAVLGAASLFEHVNEAALEDPRLEVVIQDGRNFVKTTGRKFDVITADPVHPWAAGSAYLYTTEYYAEASRHLTEGGVMCQWVPLSALSVENFKSIVATFAENFEHVSVWNTSDDIALVGSNRPFEFSMERLAERLAEPDVRRQLEWVDLADPKAFMARLAVETMGVEIYGRQAIINTDDNLYLEFSSPLAIGKACNVQSICGMAAWYPAEIRMVDNWTPLFGSAREATEALSRYRAANPPRFIKDSPRLPRAKRSRTVDS